MRLERIISGTLSVFAMAGNACCSSVSEEARQRVGSVHGEKCMR